MNKLHFIYNMAAISMARKAFIRYVKYRNKNFILLKRYFPDMYDRHAILHYKNLRKLWKTSQRGYNMNIIKAESDKLYKYVSHPVSPNEKDLWFEYYTQLTKVFMIYLILCIRKDLLYLLELILITL